MASEPDNRSLTVFVAGMVFDDSLEPPRLGDIVDVVLDFVTGREPPGQTSLRAVARPIYGHSPSQHPAGVFHWPIALTGDGWSASWSSDRPRSGRVELSGTLHVACGARSPDSPVPIRGRVSRIRLEETEFADHDSGRTVAGSERYTDIDATPHRFWSDSSPSPDDDTVTPTGVLLDLDLGDLPEPGPTFVAGCASSSGSAMWVMERSNPVLLHADTTTGVITEYLLPLTIEAPCDPWTRMVHADDGGCWITSAHDVFRCDRSDDGTLTVERRCTEGGFRSVMIDGRVHFRGVTQATLNIDSRHGTVRRDPDPHPLRELDADGHLRPVTDPTTAARVDSELRRQIRKPAMWTVDDRVLEAERTPGSVVFVEPRPYDDPANADIVARISFPPVEPRRRVVPDQPDQSVE